MKAVPESMFTMFPLHCDDRSQDIEMEDFVEKSGF